MKFLKKFFNFDNLFKDKRLTEPTEVFDFRLFYKRTPREIYIILRFVGLCHLDAYTAVQVLWDYVNVFGRLASDGVSAEEMLNLQKEMQNRWKEREKLFLSRG